MRPLRILVTGATGQIGQALLSELQNHPFVVTALSRVISSSRAKVEGSLVADITDIKSLRKIKPNFDIIFHLAASKRVFEKDGQLENINITGLKNILDVFGSSDRDTLLIYASSVDAENSRSDYAQSKRTGERIIKAFAREHPYFKYLILRIGNVDFPDLNDLSSWKKRLLYHQLGQKYLFPVRSKPLVQKMVRLIGASHHNKIVTLYDQKEKIARLIKKPPEKWPLDPLLLLAWNFIGRLTRRADLLVYLSLTK